MKCVSVDVRTKAEWSNRRVLAPARNKEAHLRWTEMGVYSVRLTTCPADVP